MRKAGKRMNDFKGVCLGMAAWMFLFCSKVTVYAQAGSDTGGKDTGADSASSTATTGITQIDTMLSTLKGLFLGVLAGIGLIILIKGIGDTAQAYQQQDSHGMYDGAKGIVAGAIMVFAGSIITLLGISG